jgi:hypothetical protein
VKEKERQMDWQIEIQMVIRIHLLTVKQMVKRKVILKQTDLQTEILKEILMGKYLQMEIETERY